jgi:hypothetical protein
MDTARGSLGVHRRRSQEWQEGRLHVSRIALLSPEGTQLIISGFGSIVVSDPEEMTRCVVDAVVESGVCAILSKGWSDRGSKKEDKGDEDGADGVKYPDSIL